MPGQTPGMWPEPRTEPTAEPQGVAFMITREMRQALRARGFTDDEVRNLTPDQAHDILARSPADVARSRLPPGYRILDEGEHGSSGYALIGPDGEEIAGASHPSGLVDEAHEHAAERRQAVDAAANDAEREPTEAQKAAGNYRKGHVSIQGLDVTIETPKGAMRRGIGENGELWENESPAHHGYIKRTEGADGEHLDTYVGDHQSDRAVVVDQADPRTGEFDEHKVVLGARNLPEAVDIYDGGFADGSGPQRRSAVTEMPIGEFKRWLERGDTTRPIAEQVGRGAEPAPAPARQRTQRADSTVPRRPRDLLEFLADQGGIRDEGGELRAMDAHRKFLPGRGMLLRANGLPHDYAREAAEEAGYLQPGSTVSDLRTAIADNLAGRRVFSDRDETAARAWDEWRRHYHGELRDEVLQRAYDLGIEHAPDAPTHELVAKIREREAAVIDADEAERAADMIGEDMDKIAGADDIPWFGDEHGTATEAPEQPQAPRQAASVGERPGARAPPEARRSEPHPPGEGAPQAAAESRIRSAATERTPQGEQGVIPGTERSARQAAASREAEGRGRIRAPGEQRAADEGLFGRREAPEDEIPFQRRGFAGGDAPLRRALLSGDVKRGAQAVIERLRMQANLDEAHNVRADRQGTRGRTPLDREQAREIEDFIDFIGHRMFDGVGLRILRRGEGSTLGAYRAYERVIEIFSNAIDSGELTRTGVHELWHSLEHVLPAADRVAVTREFQRQQEKWLRANPWARPFLRNGEMADALANRAAAAWIERYGRTPAAEKVRIGETMGRPTVDMKWTPENYRFKNRSEYFAETMADRYFDHRDLQDTKARSVFAHIRDIYRRMVEGLQRLFGRDASGRIFQGFREGRYAPADVGARDMLTEHDMGEQRRAPPGQGNLPVSTPQQRRKNGFIARSFLGKIFSPSTVSPSAKAQAALTRHEYGQARCLTQQARAGLEQFRKDAPDLGTPEGRNFMAYVEGRSAGAQLGNPSLRPAAHLLVAADFRCGRPYPQGEESLAPLRAWRSSTERRSCQP